MAEAVKVVSRALHAADDLLGVQALVDDAFDRERGLVRERLGGLGQERLALGGELDVVDDRVAIVAGGAGGGGFLGRRPCPGWPWSRPR